VVIGVQTLVFTLTFLISPLVDRLYDKRWVFILCYPVQTALALVLALTYAVGVLSIPILVAIVVLLAVLWDFTEAADETTTRLLFGKENLLVIAGLGAAIGVWVNTAIYLLGGLIMGLVLGRLNPRGYIGPIVMGAIFVMGVALLGAEVAVASLSLSLVVWFAVGATNTARVQGTWTYVQGRFEPTVLARV